MGLPPLLFAYMAGIAAAPLLPWVDALWLLPPACLLPFAILRRRRSGAVLLLLFFSSLGISLYHLQLSPPRAADHISGFASPAPLRVEGKVLEVSRVPEGRSRIDLEAEKMFRAGASAQVRGKVRLYVQGLLPSVSPGDRVRFRSRLRRPGTFGTPGEFDFPRYLAAREIFVTAFLPRSAELVVMPAARPGPSALLDGWRQGIGDVLDRAVSPGRAPLVRALVLGDKSHILPEQRDLLARGGIAHLFSISGLHLGMIALFLFAAGRFILTRSEWLLLRFPPSRALPPALIPLLLLYLLLAGNALPTRRAFIMIAAAAMLLWAGRRTPPLKLLAAAAFLLLLTSPLSLFEPAFQLSFAGVLGLMLLLPRWSPLVSGLPRLPRAVAGTALVTLAAFVGTAALVLFHFHLLAPAALLVNLVAVPLTGFVAVPLGLMGAVTAPWWPAAAELLFCGCDLTTGSVMRMTQALCSLPALKGKLLYLSPLQTVGSVLLTLAVPAWTRSPRRRLLSGVLTVGSLICILTPPPQKNGLMLTALSVGQGEALLLSRPGGLHYLIDGGGSYSDSFDPGERLIAPALGRLGIRRLEAVLLTHDHPDHWQGLVHILNHFPVGTFWSAIPESELPPPLRSVLQQRAIRHVQVPSGWTSLEDEETSALSLYAPPQSGKINDRSVALYCRLAEEGLLLTGDLEAAGVRELIRSIGRVPVSLLKLPHHGSRSSSPELLCERFRPSLAFASAGADNRYRFPHQEVGDDLRRRGIPLYSTDADGTIRFETTGREWTAETYRPGLLH